MNQYFEKIKDEFEGNAYQERLLQELQDHADYLMEDEKITLNHQSKYDFLEKRFGKPS